MLSDLPRKDHEKPLTAGPAASLPTFSSSGTAAPSAWLRCSLSGTADEFVARYLRSNELVPICPRIQDESMHIHWHICKVLI